MAEGPGRYLLDVNVLIALTNSAHVHHARVQEWFSRVDQWATTPITEAAFVRLMLNPAVAGQALPTSTVVQALSALRSLPGHRFIADDTTLAESVIDLVALQGHRQVTDLQLVNLASQHELVLATLDARIERTLTEADRQYVHLI